MSAQVGLDARIGRRVSVGMATYIREMVTWLPRVAPEFGYHVYERGGNFGIAEQVVLPLAMRRDRIDLAHYLSLYAPVATGRRFVITIHDLIHLRYERWFRAYIGPYYRTIVKRAARNAQRVITADERTIADLVHYLDVDPAKICVIPLAVRDLFFEAAIPMPTHRPYLLYVGNHRRHKDLRTLFTAWSALPKRYEIDLYVSGHDDFDGELARRSNDRRRIVALGELDDRTLARYYAGARALVHPALLEGFGLPFVEAMACGCPVIATDSSIPSILAPVSLQFPAGDAEAARAQIERLLDDDALRATLVERGTTVARTLTWERCARATAQTYRDIFEEGR